MTKVQKVHFQLTLVKSSTRFMVDRRREALIGKIGNKWLIKAAKLRKAANFTTKTKANNVWLL